MKYVRKSFSWNGRRYFARGRTEREAIEKAARMKEKLARDEVIIESGMMVKEWIDVCIDTYKTNLKPSTLAKYKARMRVCVTKPLGSYPLKSVKPIHCQRALNLQAGKSDWYIRQTRQMMSFIFSKAADNGLISANPAARLATPQGHSSSRRALTKREAEVFIKAAQKHPHGLYFMLIYGCGCRPSEAAGVQGRDFVDRNGKLYLHIRGTKSKAADRYVPVPRLVRDLLPDQLEPFLPVCTTKDGAPLCERARQRAWKSLTREMNISMGCKLYRNQLVPPFPLADDLTPYCLRHTYCTNLRDLGVDIRTAQYLMGHADIKMTANIYTHTCIDDLEADWDKIDSCDTVRATSP